MGAHARKARRRWTSRAEVRSHDSIAGVRDGLQGVVIVTGRSSARDDRFGAANRSLIGHGRPVTHCEWSPLRSHAVLEINGRPKRT